MVKSFIKWAGGKTAILPALIARVPSHFSTYYEPFLGGGALFFHLQPRKAYLSDINSELINTYSVVQSSLDDLLSELSDYTNDEWNYYCIRDADRRDNYSDWSEMQKAARFIFLNKTCYNGLYRVNSKGQFNVPYGRYKNPKIIDKFTLQSCSEVLELAHIETHSFLEIENKVNSGDFVYFDPPYQPINDKSKNFTAYSKDGFSSLDQMDLKLLCDRLSAKNVKFMLSNSDSDFIREMYSNYIIGEVLAPRSINSNGNDRGKVKELLITNY